MGGGVDVAKGGVGLAVAKNNLHSPYLTYFAYRVRYLTDTITSMSLRYVRYFSGGISRVNCVLSPSLRAWTTSEHQPRTPSISLTYSQQADSPSSSPSPQSSSFIHDRALLLRCFLLPCFIGYKVHHCLLPSIVHY